MHQFQYGHLIAVADGHGGAQCADKIISTLPQLLCDPLQEIYVDSRGAFDTPKAFQVRKVIRNALNNLLTITQNETSGSTLTVAYLENGLVRRNNNRQPNLRVTVGQIGDSVFALSTTDGHYFVVPRHSVSDCKKDINLIHQLFRKKHGRDCRSNDWLLYTGTNPSSGLAVTRSLGDRDHLLIRTPSMWSCVAPLEGTALILASDGILTDLKNPSKSIQSVINQLRNGGRLCDIGPSISKYDNTTMISVRG